MSEPRIYTRSSYCGAGHCVEVGIENDGVVVRNSRSPERAAAQFDISEWRAFVEGAKAGEFDV